MEPRLPSFTKHKRLSATPSPLSGSGLSGSNRSIYRISSMVSKRWSADVMEVTLPSEMCIMSVRQVHALTSDAVRHANVASLAELAPAAATPRPSPLQRQRVCEPLSLPWLRQALRSVELPWPSLLWAGAERAECLNGCTNSHGLVRSTEPPPTL